MNKDQYTTRELSKKLEENGCDVESENLHRHKLNKKLGKDEWDIIDAPANIGRYQNWEMEYYPAYHYYDILVTHAEEFFVDENVIEVAGHMVTYLMRRKKREEAEKHIWEYCIFNPKNKESTNE